MSEFNHAEASANRKSRDENGGAARKDATPAHTEHSP